MHKAEGVLFREALAQAAIENKVRLVRVPEKELSEFALKSLGRTADKLEAKIAELGKSVGAPWGRDQKDSAMAAMIALRRNN
jgi:hypothetical protein